MSRVLIAFWLLCAAFLVGSLVGKILFDLVRGGLNF